MLVSKEKIHDLVEIFYQSVFKIFYVNSVDNSTFIKPIGVFVSLGMTTSPKVVEDIRKIIENNIKCKASIAELISKKVGNQFLNTLSSTENPEQYELVDIPENCMDEEESKKELNKLKDPSNELKTLQENVIKVNKLQNLILKIDESNYWGSHYIQKVNDDYILFHKLVNYKKVDDLEYRIGIFVSELD